MLIAWAELVIDYESAGGERIHAGGVTILASRERAASLIACLNLAVEGRFHPRYPMTLFHPFLFIPLLPLHSTPHTLPSAHSNSTSQALLASTSHDTSQSRNF